jgi:hypothetical protein
MDLSKILKEGDALHRLLKFSIAIRGGVGDTTRYIPRHTLASKLGLDVCKVWPALHVLTGSDTISKVGTKHAAVKANPVNYLMNFGYSLQHVEDSCIKAEEYLVNVLNSTVPYKTMDELRYYKYYNSKNVTFADLPPTSFAIKGHIRRSFYAAYIQLNCLDNPDLDPKQFGFEEDNGLLVPGMCKRLLPEDLPQSCTCTKCTTRHCPCHQQDAPCCIYCKCQGFDLDGSVCRNPNVVLRVTFTVPQTL